MEKETNAINEARIEAGKIKGVEIRGESKVDRLKEISKNWSNGATLIAINEELQGATTYEERLDLLAYKCDVLEASVYGYIHSVEED